MYKFWPSVCASIALISWRIAWGQLLPDRKPYWVSLRTLYFSHACLIFLIIAPVQSLRSISINIIGRSLLRSDESTSLGMAQSHLRLSQSGISLSCHSSCSCLCIWSITDCGVRLSISYVSPEGPPDLPFGDRCISLWNSSSVIPCSSSWSSRLSTSPSTKLPSVYHPQGILRVVLA